MKNIFENPFRVAISLIVLAAIIGASTVIFSSDTKLNPETTVQEAGQKLSDMQREVRKSLEKLSDFREEKDFIAFLNQTDKKKSGFSFYVLEKNTLKYWSDNEPVAGDSLLSTIRDGQLLHLPNGDFLANTIETNTGKFVGLILLKHSYDYENKYLINNFNPELCLHNHVIADDGDTLKLPGGDFYILKYDASSRLLPSGYVVTFLFLSAFLILLAVYFLLKYFSKSVLKTVLFIAVVFLVRTFMIVLKMPSGLYDHGIFSPVYYASSFYFNSLGDMILNASLMLVLSIGFYRSSVFHSKYKAWYFLFVILVAVAIHFLIRGLVFNSGITFELSRPSSLNLYSFLAFASIAILLISFLFVVAAVLKAQSGYKITGRHAWMGIAVCSLYATFSLTGMNKVKEQEMRKLLALKAVMRQDHVAEYLFIEKEARLMSDDEVLAIISEGKNVNDRLSSFISQKYFNGYLSRFDLDVRVFNGKDTTRADGLQFYRNEARRGLQTYSDKLFFLDNETGATYLALIPLRDDHVLVMILTGRFLKSTQGFPELFMSGKNRESTPPDEYSIALYDNRSLVYEYGQYIYPISRKTFPVSGQEFSFTDLNGYNHLVSVSGKNSLIVVSKKNETLFAVLTLFSWMFSFLSLLAFLLFLLSAVEGNISVQKWNLTRRVQTSVLFLVVLTFLLVGSGTVYYINNKYENDQRTIISDQVNALWFMVNDILYISSDGNGLTERVSQLDKLVENTNIDFNIFNKDGKMSYSSQPAIFEKEIISERMNPGAYFTINETGLTQFIHPENVGLLKYIAAYAPFTNRDGNIIAYLNLPYFEKQNELNKEVSVFLSAIVNIYVFLFALALLVTIFISSRITKPLLLIQEKISGVRLGAANEKIAYKSQDEIGQLVFEYNRMIDELAKSADKLAQSERETAWREMAKQVAHEIKNPLTPMRLSVQHLYRTFKEKDYNDEQLIDRITATLLQQIDTLSNIASAFSNFAKMPQPSPEKINLEKLLHQVGQLYIEGVEIQIHSDGEEHIILADKDQMISVFTNLYKNAAQSIPEGKKGRIDVSVRRRDGEVVIEFADNGIGILEDQRDKIFTPSFTTKSSGMGLGLAIVKNIVQEASGKIWFTSTYGQGTSFYISFPTRE